MIRKGFQTTFRFDYFPFPRLTCYHLCRMKTLSQINNFPPVLLRVFARTGSRGKNVTSLSNREIAIISGLPVSKVEFLSTQKSWDNVLFSEMIAFFEGCRFNPFDPHDRNRLFAYLATNSGNPQYQFVKRAPHYETELKPILLRSDIQSAIKASILAIKHSTNANA